MKLNPSMISLDFLKARAIESFGPNRDTLEYMLYHYKHLSVIDAVNNTKSDNLGAHFAP